MFSKVKLFVYQLGQAVTKNPGYLKLRRIRAAQNIAKTVCTMSEIPQHSASSQSIAADDVSC